MIFRYQKKHWILLILSVTLAVKQTKKTTNKQTNNFLCQLLESTIKETRKKKATLQGSERRERENSNQAESFQNQQTEASLLNNKKKSFFMLTNLSFNDTDGKRISFLIHNFLSCFVA